MAIPTQRKIVITNEKEFQERMEKVSKQLENLKKQTSKGKISAPIAAKLKGELENELQQIEEELIEKIKNEKIKVQSEIERVNTAISARGSKRSEISAQKDELEARYRIGQIDRKEFKAGEERLVKQIRKIEEEISKDSERLKKLQNRLEYVTNFLKTKDLAKSGKTKKD
jgi:chromosome segregation ATPase